MQTLIPQREGFGLCGTVPSLLSVDAWLEQYGNKSELLKTSLQDVFNDTSRINAYSMRAGNGPAQVAQLMTCAGASATCVQVPHVS